MARHGGPYTAERPRPSIPARACQTSPTRTAASVGSRFWGGAAVRCRCGWDAGATPAAYVDAVRPAVAKMASSDPDRATRGRRQPDPRDPVRGEALVSACAFGDRLHRNDRGESKPVSRAYNADGIAAVGVEALKPRRRLSPRANGPLLPRGRPPWPEDPMRSGLT
jgi:hypothetical protein